MFESDTFVKYQTHTIYLQSPTPQSVYLCQCLHRGNTLLLLWQCVQKQPGEDRNLDRSCKPGSKVYNWKQLKAVHNSVFIQNLISIRSGWDLQPASCQQHSLWLFLCKYVPETYSTASFPFKTCYYFFLRERIEVFKKDHCSALIHVPCHRRTSVPHIVAKVFITWWAFRGAS